MTRSGAGIDVNAGTEGAVVRKQEDFVSTGTSLPAVTAAQDVTRATETPQPGLSSPVPSPLQADIGSISSKEVVTAREKGGPSVPQVLSEEEVKMEGNGKNVDKSKIVSPAVFSLCAEVLPGVSTKVAPEGSGTSREQQAPPGVIKELPTDREVEGSNVAK